MEVTKDCLESTTEKKSLWRAKKDLKFEIFRVLVEAPRKYQHPPSGLLTGKFLRSKFHFQNLAVRSDWSTQSC